MEQQYIDSMQAHVDEGGKLSHQNAVDLLAEVVRLRAVAESQEQAIAQITADLVHR